MQFLLDPSGISFSIDEEQRGTVDGIYETPVRMQLLPFRGNGFVSTLWTWKVFQVINSACSINIDYYEEEILPPEKIDKAIVALKKLRPDIFDHQIIAFIDLSYV